MITQENKVLITINTLGLFSSFAKTGLATTLESGSVITFMTAISGG